MAHRRFWAIGFAVTVTLAGPATAAELKQVGIIKIPGQPLMNFDISYVDQATGMYYFSDRTNKGVDIFDTKTDRFVGRVEGFVGAIAKTDGSGKVNTHVSGPNGVMVAEGAIWAGDGNSTIKIIDPTTMKITATIATGGTQRTNDFAYDPKDHLIIAENKNDEPPFATLMSTKLDHAVIGKVAFEHATDGIEQAAYNPDDGLFYLSIPEFDKDAKKGGVAVIDPLTAKVLKVIPVEGNCHPQGLHFGPGGNFIVGCDMPDETVIVSAKTGSVVTVIEGIGGADMVDYNAKNGQYYTASWYNRGGGALGVIDAATNKLVQTIPLGGGAHSAASSEVTGHVYVPVGTTDGGDGTVHVYAPK